MEDPKVRVNCIYRATEGEGIAVGRPQIFIRLQGCRVGCRNCDSKETWDFGEGQEMEMDRVLGEVDGLADGNIRWVSLTGGDPLDPAHLKALDVLIHRLAKRGYAVNLEASGTRIVPEIFRRVDFISFDYKTPSTGVRTPVPLLLELSEHYLGKFQIKSVVEDEGDFHACLKAREELERADCGIGFEWCLTPAYSPHERFDPARFTKIMSLNMEHGSRFRVIGQQHKWVYGPRQRRV
ncbi:MAG: 7-carboxy-7-deazaguanine synthase QueE [Bacteriovoracales bacterium]|nr:7-carboxy-7-deazaguanine synthase QueE [Bacteriovoracales bacterium]